MSSIGPRWIEQTNRFYYRRTIKGGQEWILVDGATQEKKPAFDHAKLAAAIAAATTRKATATELPFTTFTFVDDGEGHRVHPRRRAGWTPRRGPGRSSRRPALAVLARHLHLPTATGTRRSGRSRRRRGPCRSGATAVRHQRRGAETLAGQKVRGAGQQLQRRDP